MKKTFECNESIIITIPIGNLGDAEVARLMPEKFTCAFKDSYKIFVLGGKPKPVGAAQAIAGVLLCLLLLFDIYKFVIVLPNLVYVIIGLLTYAAGKGPRMIVAKLSLSLNILGLFWSVAAISLHCIIFPYEWHRNESTQFFSGVNGLTISLLVVEHCLCLFSICWLSRAICRKHFNTLPIILLKQGN